jgi:hypothetical protein
MSDLLAGEEDDHVCGGMSCNAGGRAGEDVGKPLAPLVETGKQLGAGGESERLM